MTPDDESLLKKSSSITSSVSDGDIEFLKQWCIIISPQYL
jgi:hypothetical protein